jgi:hypothetical protein
VGRVAVGRVDPVATEFILGLFQMGRGFIHFCGF